MYYIDAYRKKKSREGYFIKKRVFQIKDRAIRYCKRLEREGIKIVLSKPCSSCGIIVHHFFDDCRNCEKEMLMRLDQELALERDRYYEELAAYREDQDELYQLYHTGE